MDDIQDKSGKAETDQKHEELHKDEENPRFEDIFLDSRHKIKKEIHEELRSFSWLRGAYGLTGPNKKIRRPHIFLTVKRGIAKFDVRNELGEKFNCDPKEHFELLQEPRRKPKLKYLGQVLKKLFRSNIGSEALTPASSIQPSPGCGILAYTSNICNSLNPLRVLGEVGDSLDLQGTGTLTMFCSPNGHHYALTCFHVGCANDENKLNAEFNEVEDIQKVRKSLDDYVQYAKKQQYYFQNTNDGCHVRNNEHIVFADDGRNYTRLGDFDNYYFDYECDILSVKILDDIEIDCEVAGVTCPDWGSIWDELYERVINTTGEDPVEVEKIGFSSALTRGHIVTCEFNYTDGDNPLFQDAIVVKGSSGAFLKGGDSGSLVFFRDVEGRKQVFAYGVCEVDVLYLPDESTSFNDGDNDASSIWNGEDLSCSFEEEDVGYVGEYEKDYSAEDENKCKHEWGDEHKARKSEDNSSDQCGEAGVVFQEEGDQSNVNASGQYFICLRLDTALENLGLQEAACFNCCGKTEIFYSV